MISNLFFSFFFILQINITEVTDILSQLGSFNKWLNDTVEQQEKLDDTEEPVLTQASVSAKTKSITDFLTRLLRKPRKMPSFSPKAKKSSTSNETNSTSEEEETVADDDSASDSSNSNSTNQEDSSIPDSNSENTKESEEEDEDSKEEL